MIVLSVSKHANKNLGAPKSHKCIAYVSLHGEKHRKQFDSLVIPKHQ